jgi:hypothetical protein
MEQIFFSQKNQLALYDIVRSRIQKLQNYDIAHDPKWANEIVKVMQHVYANQPHFGIDPKMQPMQKSEVLTKKAIQVAAQTIQNELARNRPAVAPNTVQPRTTFTQQYEQPRVTMPNTFQQTPPSQNYTSPVMNQPQTQYTSMQQPMQQIPQYTSYQMQQSQGHASQPQQSYNDPMKERYDQLNSQYKVQASKPETINFADANYNPASTNTDIQSRYDEIMKQRDSELKQSQQQLSAMSGVPVPATQSQQHIVMNVQVPVPDRMSNASAQPPLSMPSFASQFESSSGTSSMSSSSGEPEYMAIFNSTTIDPKNVVSYKELSMQQTAQPSSYSDSPNNYIQSTPIHQQLLPSNNSQGQGQVHSQDFIQSTPIHHVSNVSHGTPVQHTSNMELESVKKSVELTQQQMQQYVNQLSTITEKWNQIDLSSVYQTILNIPEVIRQQQNQPLVIHPTNLIVSSSDRDFNNKEFDKYNFRVIFGEEGSKTVTNYSSSSLNTFSSTTGTYHTGYTGPAIKQMLRNVVSIKLRRVVIPQPLNAVYYPEPYYLVAIDEFDSNIVSTSNVGHRIACKIHYDDVLTFGDRKYLYYKNDDDDVTMFYPSPLSKLDRMTLRLLTPDGESVKSNFNDSDIAVIQDLSTNRFNCNIDFYNNTFAKDKLIHLESNTKLRTTMVDAPSYPNGNFTIHTNATNGVLHDNDTIVNLSNQISYIFEVRTQEPDRASEVRPII